LPLFMLELGSQSSWLERFSCGKVELDFAIWVCVVVLDEELLVGRLVDSNTELPRPWRMADERRLSGSFPSDAQSVESKSDHYLL
jgi:hypothetical protein